ncbi:MAG: 50S ribosomal protein L28 [Lentisphaerae bacterium GWF2_52_8]|nr:MAG: 50S ribosomal protein L28 [Lentisphaerae bacterium GWF2_52_8]
MSKVCEICGKGKVVGGSVVRKGLAKKVGGIGMHVVKNTKRIFKPNLQTLKVRTGEGSVGRKKVCSACIRAGRVQKA